MEETKPSAQLPADLAQEGFADVGKWLGRLLAAPGKKVKAEVVDTVQLGAAAGLDALEAALPAYFALGEGRKVKLHAELVLWVTLEE